MATLKPWYRVVTPREDLREGKPLDASEFAVHLDQIRDGRAPSVYQKPEEFFERTYLTKNLISLAAEVVRRLSGETTEASAVFNMTTAFGGGKTHALTLLYHLASNGPKAEGWHGVTRILEKAGVKSIPKAATAVFIGTEFDSITGRGGDDGTPLRKTPWGEIAFQLGGADTLSLVAEHEKKGVAPAGDVIRRMLPNDGPCVILIDEVMNYIGRNRKSGLSSQMYEFIQNLSETARGEKGVVAAISIPESRTEIGQSEQDFADYQALRKLLDRLSKAVVMSAEGETSEIIRRRLFEWEGLTKDAKQTIAEYAALFNDHRDQIPGWFPVDHAREVLSATYPFHPAVLSVFERKWQSLQNFQRTRGVLRLLALWVSKAYQDGFKGAHRDPLIALGSAPLDDPLFRAALFEQLGEQKLEVAITTDICGKAGSHAVRLDDGAVQTIKSARLHRKSATAVFFESNGGQTKDRATMTEVRLAALEPAVDIGNIETALNELASTCFYLTVDKNMYRFSLKPNLNKILADRQASIKAERIEELVKAEVGKVFESGPDVVRVYFPEKSKQVPDKPVLTWVILGPEHSTQDKKTPALVESMTREYGTSARTFKSALIWCVPDSDVALRDAARNVLAWSDIEDERDDLGLDDTQRRRLAENLKKSERDLIECVWRTYHNLLLLDKDNSMRHEDLGLIHSSSAKSILDLLIGKLKQSDEITDHISPNQLLKNWPPAFEEWSTKDVRDAIFSSPKFSRLLDSDAIRDTVSKGVANGMLGYLGKMPDGSYEPFYYKTPLSVDDVEISDDMFIIMGKAAEAYDKGRAVGGHKEAEVAPDLGRAKPGAEVPTGSTASKTASGVTGTAEVESDEAAFAMEWSGAVAPQKWMNFYTKVLSRFAARKDMKLTLTVEFSVEGGIAEHQVEEVKVALRELGLDDDVEVK